MTIKLPDFTRTEIDIIHLAFGNLYGYQTTVQDPENSEATIPNPKSIEGFVSDKVAAFIDNAITENANRQALQAVPEVKISQEALVAERAKVVKGK